MTEQRKNMGVRIPFCEGATGMRFVDDFSRWPLSVSLGEGIVEPDSFDNVRAEYFLEARLRVHFYAGRTNYELAREEARKYLLHTLYAPVLSAIKRARYAVHSGNAQEALAALREMEEELGL